MTRWIDWQRHDVHDGVVIFALATVVYLAAHFYDLPPKLFQFALDNAEWEVDDVIFVIFVISVALVVYAFRRTHDLSREIKARRVAELEARTLARHDPLTGLPNRRCFSDYMTEILDRALLDGHRPAMLMLDLDGFKTINDSFGHAAGDAVLIEFASRLAPICTGAMLARFGGDEFAVLRPGIGSIDEATRLARQIIAAASAPYVIGTVTANLSVCIGIAIAPDDGQNVEELVRRADVALYRAKADGRGNARFFEPEMDAMLEMGALMERDLRAAIAENAIEVHYQPLIRLDGEQIVGFEALARWTHPTLGSIMPVIFIPLAEECGLISQLGEQVLRTACREASRWPKALTLAVNVSAIQLRDPQLGLRVLAILGETGLNPTQLEIEITESAIVGDPKIAQRVIGELRAAGIRIALDDFGTGYATMSQLLSLRFDRIKIDRSLISRVGHDPDSMVIVRAIIGLAAGLGLATTAEGIEDSATIAMLRASGCEEAQGYLFGKAMPARDIPAILRQQTVTAVVA